MLSSAMLHSGITLPELQIAVDTQLQVDKAPTYQG